MNYVGCSLKCATIGKLAMSTPLEKEEENEIKRSWTQKDSDVFILRNVFNHKPFPDKTGR